MYPELGHSVHRIERNMHRTGKKNCNRLTRLRFRTYGKHANNILFLCQLGSFVADCLYCNCDQNLNEPIRKKHLTQDLTSWSHHNNNRWDVNCFDFILVWWCIQEPKERKKEDMAHKDNYYNMIKWWTDKHQFRQECMEGYWWRGHTARELAWRRLRVQHVRLGLTGHEDATSFSPTEVPPGISAWLTRPLGYLGYPCPTKWDLSVAAYPIHSYKFMEGDKVSLGS